MPDLNIFIAFMAGILSFLSPCVLPLVPSYLVFLSGSSIDNMVETRKRALQMSLLFVLGFSTVFILLGASATLLGHVVRANADIFSMIAGVLIIIMGLHFLGVFKIPFIMNTLSMNAAPKTGGVGAFLMGLSFGFGWTPCIGPILASILALAASEATITKGLMLLTSYSLGLGVPFLLAALLINPFIRMMKNMRGKMIYVEKASGVLMILTGILFLSGSINTISIWLLEAFPALGKIG